MFSKINSKALILISYCPTYLFGINLRNGSERLKHRIAKKVINQLMDYSIVNKDFHQKKICTTTLCKTNTKNKNEI